MAHSVRGFSLWLARPIALWPMIKKKEHCGREHVVSQAAHLLVARKQRVSCFQLVCNNLIQCVWYYFYICMVYRDQIWIFSMLILHAFIISC